jgi:uncharacterized protein YjbJ (UPF0337 family)
MRRAAAAVVAGLGSLALALAGCSSGDSPAASSGSRTSSASSSSAPAVCASADQFRSSLSSLADVQVVQEGTGSLQAAWTKVQDDWGQFADDARANYSGDVDGVQADADAAKDAVGAAVANTSAQTLAAAGTAITTFVQSAGALVDEVRSTC